MNIDFVKGDYRFNARVLVIIFNADKTKVLLFKVEDGRDFFMLPGGRIEFYEDSKTAIEREVKEELNINLDCELCAIQENFVTQHGQKITQYCFCYQAIYDGETSTNKIQCKDNVNQTFSWINISEINNYKIYPTSTYELIKNPLMTIEHSIERI